MDSVYLPERTLTVVPEEAAPTAAEIVKNALSIDVPLLVSEPSFATYMTFGAELIPDALELIVTPVPIVTLDAVIVTLSSPPI